MPFRVIQPPSDKEQFAEAGKRIYAAAKKLNVPLDPEGFLFSWVNGTRVLVEEQDDEIVGLVLLSMGKRWTHSDTTATILVLETTGDHDGLVDFTKQIASAFGSTELFLQSKAVQQINGVNHYKVFGYLLG